MPQCRRTYEFHTATNNITVIAQNFEESAVLKVKAIPVTGRESYKIMGRRSSHIF
jgi:hypothetical protein